MIFNFNELDNSSNLKDGRPSDALFTYYVYLVLKILHVLNPKPHNTGSLKMVRLFP